MKPVDRIVLYECSINVEYKGTYTSGWKDPDTPIFFLEIRAGGVSGYGECVPVNELYPPGSVGHTGYDERKTLLELCQSLIGKDPLQLGRLIPDSLRRHETNNLMDAVDFALHDLVGKTYGIPVRALLGGIAKPFVWGMPVIYTADPEVMSDKAREWHKRYGFRYFKLKPNGNAEKDEATLRKVREKTSREVTVFADPNYALNTDADGVVTYLNHLAPHGLAMCEDPIDADFKTYAEIRRRSKVPLMIDHHARTDKDVFDMANTRAADAINIHANWAGGFQPALRRAHLAALGGISVMIGSTHYLGVGAAAYQILSSLMPGDMPCEQVNVEVYGGKGIVKNPFEIRDGKILIEDRPGIGVEPNFEELQSRCQRKHEICN